MARPKPIIVSGGSPLGSSTKEEFTKANIDLGGIMDFLAKKKQKKEFESNLLAALSPTKQIPAQVSQLGAQEAAPGELEAPLLNVPQMDITEAPSEQTQALVKLLGGGIPEGAPPQLGKAISNLLFPAATERKTLKDVAGVQRFVDKGERVFPGVETPIDAPKVTAETDEISSGMFGVGYNSLERTQQKEVRKEKIRLDEIKSNREGVKLVSNIRKEFNGHQNVKEFVDTRRKFQVMQSAFNESKKTKNFVAVDQALITIFNKMTDPSSVVRESEYARTASDLAIWNRIKGKVSKLKAGGAGLTQDDRKALMEMAGKFMNASQVNYNDTAQFYRDISKDANIDPKRVVQPLKQIEVELGREEENLNKLKSKYGLE